MLTYWLPITGFPNYDVNNHGQVRNNKHNKILKPSHTMQGALKINLLADGKYYTRSVKVLVAEAFIPKPRSRWSENRTLVPVQLDNDQENVDSDNLVWRTRSFAVQYKQQFTDENIRWCKQFKDVVELPNGRVYEDAWAAGISNGLLARIITRNFTNQDLNWPTGQVFILQRDVDKPHKQQYLFEKHF